MFPSQHMCLCIVIKRFKARFPLPDKQKMFMDDTQAIDTMFELQKWHINQDNSPIKSFNYLPVTTKGISNILTKTAKKRQMFTLISSIIAAWSNLSVEIFLKKPWFGVTTNATVSENYNGMDWNSNKIRISHLKLRQTLDHDKLRLAVKRHSMWKPHGEFKFGLFWGNLHRRTPPSALHHDQNPGSYEISSGNCMFFKFIQWSEHCCSPRGGSFVFPHFKYGSNCISMPQNCPRTTLVPWQWKSSDNWWI